MFPPTATTGGPSTASEGEKQTYRIRLVPHLENARSLHFEPIVRDVRVGGPPLRVGRFTDRATNPTRGNGLNPNDKNSDKVAFRSKVVSRAHAELWVQGKGVVSGLFPFPTDQFQFESQFNLSPNALCSMRAPFCS